VFLSDNRFKRGQVKKLVYILNQNAKETKKAEGAIENKNKKVQIRQQVQI
jgi:hypothetical protein